MGAAKSSALCCSSSTNVPCCTKSIGQGMEIRARGGDYPGITNDNNGRTFFGDFEGDEPELAKAAGRDPSRDRPLDQDQEETYEDGSTYIGQLVDGRRHGKGVWTSATEQYSGQWKCDQRDGRGSQVWQDGRLYEGQFVDGKFHGRGRMEWHTKLEGLMVYDGEYVDDVKHGHGVYTWPDGRVYDGQWVNGRRSGKALYTKLGGEKKYGIWNNDKIERWLDNPAGGAAPQP